MKTKSFLLLIAVLLLTNSTKYFSRHVCLLIKICSKVLDLQSSIFLNCLIHLVWNTELSKVSIMVVGSCLLLLFPVLKIYYVFFKAWNQKWTRVWL